MNDATDGKSGLYDLERWRGFTPHTEVGVDAYLAALKELATEHPSIKLKGQTLLNRALGGFRTNEFTILCGATGCLSGESLIPINRAGKGFQITIRELYLRTMGIASNRSFDKSIPTYVRSYDGESVQLNKMVDVYLSGIKETWRFKFHKTGHIYLRATPSHRFLTERGWVRGDELIIGEKVAYEFKYATKGKEGRKKINDEFYVNIKYHPYASRCRDKKRIVKHRAIFEANLNNITIEEFLRCLRYDEEKSKTLQFVDPKEFHIHHKDHNHKNNAIENLQKVRPLEHRKLHGEKNFKNFNQGRIRWHKFYGYDRIGVEPVFDIECEKPHSNFVANTMIVHNSGKTTALCNWSKIMLESRIPHFVASVECGSRDYTKRTMSVFASRDLNGGDRIPVEFLKTFDDRFGEHYRGNVMHLGLYDNRVSHLRILEEIQFHREMHGCKIAFIDNLNFLMEVVAEKNAVVEMDRVVHDFIMFVKRNDVHIVMVMHPKKTVDGRVTSEFDIKGSSTAVQEAQNVLLFNRMSKESSTYSPNKRVLTFAKLRRRGQYSGSSIIYDSPDGATYIENGSIACR